ncbi:beta-lactamase family protein [Parvularcula sp. ZS-1/3]|uniref:Beta-lactamase family protein n=1 Tax=Parvularcula mediterranea TaxID=2732508 RepID=A0A7Y3RKV2_9PROT|nr:serine hydrolase domain-containing protein [Parvularcula mediterranea]NNU15943.1 beta-lactamase family protein [Parvularcula mediterranea]
MKALAAALLSVSFSASQALAGGAVIAVQKGGAKPEIRVLGDGVSGEAYQVGSIGKVACTLAALSLEKRGKLYLDSPIGELLPGYDGVRPEVTLRQLLANRAGIADGAVAALLQDRSVAEASMPALDAANRFATEATDDAPDTTFDYVQTNWVIIQAILEEASDKPITKLIQREVLRPARMRDSYVFIGDLDRDGIPQTETPYLPLPDFISCAGGLAATPEDIIKLSRLPFVSRRFDEARREALMAVTTEEQDYTLGGRFETVTDREGNTRRISWQSGNNGPWSAQVIYDHVQDVAWSVVSLDGDFEAILADRAQWLESEGLTWDEAPAD